MKLENTIERILLDEEIIKKRVQAMAEEILDEMQEGEDLMVILLLKGALVFAADLLRCLPLPLQIECLNVSSYHGEMESSGTVDFLDRKLPEVKGKSILLVDDILDTGRTLHAVSEKLQQMGAETLKKCVLLSKDKERSKDVDADYVGFIIGDEFVVGYGLDYQGRYRNLPYIGILKPSSP